MTKQGINIYLFLCILFLCHLSAQDNVSLTDTFNLITQSGSSAELVARFQDTLTQVLNETPSYRAAYQQLSLQAVSLKAKGAAATPEELNAQSLNQHNLISQVMKDVVHKDATLAPIAAKLDAVGDPYLPQLNTRLSKMPPGVLNPEERFIQYYTAHQVKELFPDLDAEKKKLQEERKALYADGRQPTPDELAEWQKKEDLRQAKFRFAANLINPSAENIYKKIDASRKKITPPTGTPATPDKTAPAVVTTPNAPSTPPTPPSPPTPTPSTASN